VRGALPLGESYIARLISKGYKVAICEQMEDPALAKGLVDRDIIRIVTPGTVIESSMLEEGRNNFLCSICLQEPAVGVCFCDISTGEVSATAFAGKDAMEHLWNELGRYAPREAVLSPPRRRTRSCWPSCGTGGLPVRAGGGGPASKRSAAWALCRKQFRTGLEGLPEQGEAAAVRAAGALLDYSSTPPKRPT
jgi:DNA mismatch repair protein MutS